MFKSLKLGMYFRLKADLPGEAIRKLWDRYDGLGGLHI